MPITSTSTPRRADPRTKEDFLDRMMARDFSGDLSDLAAGRKLSMERMKPHIVRLRFGDSGKVFDLTIHKPRSEAEATKTKLAARQAAAEKRARNRLLKQKERERKVPTRASRKANGSAARQ